MKHFFLLFCLSLSMAISAQQTIIDTIQHGGLDRRFTVYIPALYNGSEAVPLVFNFHGYTSNMSDQMWYGDFRQIADTANFIVVHPQGTLDGNGQTYFNANWGGTVDDIGFTEALIDSLSAEYNINLNRVYSTGMSNGGFMSYTLACELSSRIAAIASVTGTMNYNQTTTCNPQHQTPVMEIHGTNDGTVPYTGNGTMESVDNVIDYWVTYNQADVTPVFANLPDINSTDGSTVEHYLYENGTNGSTVELLKIIGGGHTWPGTPFGFSGTNKDINASFKIWEFFAQYDINGKVTSTPTLVAETSNYGVKIYPNPASEIITVTWISPIVTNIRLINAVGVEVRNITVKNQTNVSVPTHELSRGVYFLKVGENYNRVVLE